MGSIEATLPYWQVDVPEELRSQECPEYLTGLDAKNIRILSTPDSQYRVLTWPEVRRIIADNRLDLLQRVPSDLRRYLAYNYGLKKEYGSVMEFVRRQRLGWDQPIVPEGGPFEKEGDLKILVNDWPYGIDKKIVHLVVWTKFALKSDPRTGDLTDQARKEIADYVEEAFARKMGKENVIWFKNWRSLQSLPGLEHFHVMLYNPPPGFVKEVTKGDITLSQIV